jgi:hypothetical protein
LASHVTSEIDGDWFNTAWCSANMDVVTDEYDFNPDVFQIRTDVWLQYQAMYTEWEVTADSQRILRTHAEANGAFKIPP